MIRYDHSREHDLWQGVFFVLLMAFTLIVTPLLLGQEHAPASAVNINGTMVTRPTYPLFQSRVYGTIPGQCAVYDAYGYLTGAECSSGGPCTDCAMQSLANTFTNVNSFQQPL